MDCDAQLPLFSSSACKLLSSPSKSSAAIRPLLDFSANSKYHASLFHYFLPLFPASLAVLSLFHPCLDLPPPHPDPNSTPCIEQRIVSSPYLLVASKPRKCSVYSQTPAIPFVAMHISSTKNTIQTWFEKMTSYTTTERSRQEKSLGS